MDFTNYHGKIILGSENPIKLGAVRYVLQEYGMENPVVFPTKIDSGVSNQPKSLEETIQGSINRSQKASKLHKHKKSVGFLSFGLEGGLMKIPDELKSVLYPTEFMNVLACSIYDGNSLYFGLSSGFMIPRNMSDLITQNNMEMEEAALKLGYTEEPEIGEAEGLIGILTKNKLVRLDLAKQSVLIALSHLDNKEMYVKK